MGFDDEQMKTEADYFVDRTAVKLIFALKVNDTTAFIFRGSQYVWFLTQFFFY